MKRSSLLIASACLFMVGPALAEPGELGVSLDLSYWTKWLSKGLEAYGQQGALFKTIDIDLYGTGFGLKVTHRNAMASGYVDQQRIDYRPYYKNQAFADTCYAMNYNISVEYESYTGLDSDKANTTYEWINVFSWPNLFPKGPVPRYIMHNEYPAEGGNANRDATGWVHRFGFDYDLNSPVEGMPLRLSSEVAYTDGLGRASHDWSYANVGLSTKLALTKNLCFVPALYYQISMDSSVSSKKDITYAILSMKYKF